MAQHDPSEESSPSLTDRVAQYARNEAPEGVRGEAVYEMADVLVCTGATVGVAVLVAHALGLGRYTTTLAAIGVVLVGVITAVAVAVRTAIRAVHAVASTAREQVKHDARRYRRR